MGPNDRIRRILSDGAPRPARRGAPVLRQVADDEADRSEVPTPIPPSLRERLRILDRLSRRAGPLRVDARASQRAQADYEPIAGLEPPAEGIGVHPPGPLPTPDELPRSELPVEAIVGGCLRETSAGSCWQVDLRYPLDAQHGAITLRDAFRHPLPLRPHERGPGAGDHLDWQRAAFIDTETTGLAGGTGTVAFLIGAGWVDGDDLLVRQYFMRDYPEEAGMLQAVREDLRERPLVSFNGRSYDWPLLVTRWKLSRTRWDDSPQHGDTNRSRGMTSPWTPGPRTHLDLLPLARRLWSRTLHSRSLGTIERHVLGLARGADLPGASIPAAYFHYLRTGYSHAIARAFRHNQIDIVSMLALLASVSQIIANPQERVAHPGDALGTARLLIDLGDPTTARACLDARLLDATRRDQPEMRRLLAKLCRSAGDIDQALAHWKALTEAASGFDREAYEQVAKVYEHQLRDYGTALAWTRKALVLTTPGSPAHEALAHRATRLERRQARANQTRANQTRAK